jgi:hypothetical protein
MNKFVILSCVAVLVLFVLLYAFKPDYFVKSNIFGNVNKMMLIGPDGTIILQPAGDIDSSINATQDAARAEFDTITKDYQTKAEMAPYMTTAGYVAKSTPFYAGFAAGIKANKDSAVQKGALYAIKMGPGNKANANENRYMQGSTDNWRVSYGNTNPAAKWSFV